MTFEAIIGVAVVLAIFATIMFFAFRQRQRESQQLMEAYEAGDRTAVRRWILSGVVTLTGFVAMIGYEEGVEGAISVFAGLAVCGGLIFFAWCAVRLWRHRLERDDSSSGPRDQNDNRFLLGGMLLASATFVGGTATLVVFHGATTIVIYYVVVPLVVGLILFLQWSYRRLRRKTSPG